MDQKINHYISAQPADRIHILSLLHKIILKNDNTVVAELGLMMGKEMIIYKSRGMMKYALASVKDHMSLHVLPIYVSKDLFEKYKAIMPKTKFQKGCINFSKAEDLPFDIVENLVIDCSAVDLIAIREAQLSERKSKAKIKKA